MNEIIFTPAGLLEILCKIEELQDLSVSLTETLGGKLQLQVGESVYELQQEQEAEVAAPVQVIEEVDAVNEAAYREMLDSSEFESSEPVEAGLLSEIVKALKVGGMIRLAAKTLKNNLFK